MKRGYVLGILSEEEEKKYIYWRNVRDKLFLPLCKYLGRFNVSPNFLSYVGFLMVVLFIYFFPVNPWFSFLAILLNVLMDAIDGPYARYARKESFAGEVTDIACDYGSFVVIFLTILFYGLMNTFWAVLYLVSYLVMLALVFYSNKKKISFFTVFRSKYYFYGMLLFLLITGKNIFDPFLVFFSVYMIITNILLADRIRCSIR
jgi:phosphatidylglycerophosphate synthase